MSSKTPAIKVAGVSKCFNIYDRPRDRLLQMLVPKLRKLLGGSADSSFHREYRALDDVNFEVLPGETVGIIGQNGSGKSTLLQIITGTMSPTVGCVETHGRIGALLELGSGFNPEFTGRENVFLNGSLLGLTRKEIEEKFDYIVGFADIGDHLDQPVKTYSSGMKLRLAFAVQVAVDADVLIIDEALAVGDAKFQKKCFRRLEEIKARGTTILFVSHSTEQIRSFCDRGLVLEKGKVIFWGDAKEATVKYLASVFPDQTAPQNDTLDPLPAITTVDAKEPGWFFVRPDQSELHSFGVGGATLNWCRIHGLDHPATLPCGRKVTVQCDFSWDSDFLQSLIASGEYTPNITLGITLSNKKGTYLFGCNGFDSGLQIDCMKFQHRTVEFNFSVPYLASGDYFLGVAIALGNMSNHVQLKWHDNLLHMQCVEGERKVFGVFAIDYSMAEISL